MLGLTKSAFKHVLLIHRCKFNGFPYVSYVLSMTVSVYSGATPPRGSRTVFVTTVGACAGGGAPAAHTDN